ncbi:hypothetical protein GIB67_027258 [Kingdonia uniflora]|uniref:Aminotransferase-like plant mobile domain-containing protein n=1 Tax=Kingdonia uniflora TaxID=39325 RepID=A0A7J7KYN1_9MAGN|nr:hypothetical protein GIB67_027258 [Kingdonia uniflora]
MKTLRLMKMLKALSPKTMVMKCLTTMVKKRMLLKSVDNGNELLICTRNEEVVSVNETEEDESAAETAPYTLEEHVEEQLPVGEEQFENHPAEEEPGTLKCHHHPIKWDLHNEDPSVRFQVAMTHLGHLCKIAYNHHNGFMTTAFVEHWHAETSSFYFNFGEMAILLKDVVKLIGLPVKGKCLPGIGKNKDVMKVFCNLLGLTDKDFRAAKSKTFAMTIRMAWLQ